MIRPVQKADYPVPWEENPMLHEEIEWYATEDDSCLGAVIRDRLDDDFGWIALKNLGGFYQCVDVACSYPTLELATLELHRRMQDLRG